MGGQQPGVGKRLAVAALCALHHQPTGKVVNGTIIDRGDVPASLATRRDRIDDFLVDMRYSHHLESQNLERACVCHDCSR
jgi:hypothetical protein